MLFRSACFSQPIYAQNNRTASTTTSQASKQKIAHGTTLSFPTKIKMVAESDTHLYLLETPFGNNALWTVDKQNGDVAMAIKGVDGIYEGVRPRIRSIAATSNGRLFYATDEVLYEYNHNDPANPTQIQDGFGDGNKIIMSIDSTNTFLTVSEEAKCVQFDLRTMQQIGRAHV